MPALPRVILDAFLISGNVRSLRHRFCVHARMPGGKDDEPLIVEIVPAGFPRLPFTSFKVTPSTMSQSPYIDRREAAKSYRPKAGTMSPGLQRAREPYRVKNALLGLALGAFAVGVWAYSINAVKQDVFDDVDDEVAALSAGSNSRQSAVTTTGEGITEQVITSKSASGVSTVSTEVAGALADAAAGISRHRVRGVLPHLDKRLPGLLDPERKTLVWGATPLDKMGKMGDRS